MQGIRGEERTDAIHRSCDAVAEQDVSEVHLCSHRREDEPEAHRDDEEGSERAVVLLDRVVWVLGPRVEQEVHQLRHDEDGCRFPMPDDERPEGDERHHRVEVSPVVGEGGREGIGGRVGHEASERIFSRKTRICHVR